MLAIAALLFYFTPSIPVSIPDATVVTKTASAAADKDSSSTTAEVAVKGTDLSAKPAVEPHAQPGGQKSKPASEALAKDSRQRTMEVAENYSLFSAIRITEGTALKPTPVIGVEHLPSRRTWIILSAAQHAAAAFDAYSTRDAIANGAAERDPLMKPFAGSPGIYAAIQVLPLALDYTARKMQRDQHGIVRHMWWLPQAASSVGFLYSGAHNLRVAGQR